MPNDPLQVWAAYATFAATMIVFIGVIGSIGGFVLKLVIAYHDLQSLKKKVELLEAAIRSFPSGNHTINLNVNGNPTGSTSNAELQPLQQGTSNPLLGQFQEENREYMNQNPWNNMKENKISS